MNPNFHEFEAILITENRREALSYILNLLDRENLSIPQLYSELLAPALNGMTPSGNEKLDIWKEHVRSSIIRAIIENCYPYVLKERDRNNIAPLNRKVAVICPAEEYHELGARMITDYFTLLGYDATFVGSNTPKEVFVAGLQTEKFDDVALSITNPYHLVSARNTIALVRQFLPKVRILVGGYALTILGDERELLKADAYVYSYHDLASLAGGHHHEATL